MSQVKQTASTPVSIQKPLDPEAQKKLPALIPRKKRGAPRNPLPTPQARPLPPPPDLNSLKPLRPSRRILSNSDHDLFQKSKTYDLLLSFIFTLAGACEDKKISEVSKAKHLPIVKKLESILDSISGLVDSNPPLEQGASRFGNPAFKSFMDDVSSHLSEYHGELGLPSSEWADEVSVYLENSFGSKQRIDYGSGHELNFIVWLLCLNRLSILPPETFPAVALLVFPKYIRLMRRIQLSYYLEPAGSHGVWGLDDYHFLPFLFGASQLLHHPYITPLAIHNELVLEEESPEFMYLDMVRWTVETKTVKGLRWTQPMLDDISGAKNWEKVEQGMQRMFVKEVLGKLPIMQHFLFGSLVPAEEGMSTESDMDAQLNEAQSHAHPGHVHRDDVWGDCCGIKIPSTIAASEEIRKKGAGEGFRRVPFD